MLQWCLFPKNNNMPNWCFTTYKLCGFKESVEPFYEMLKELEDMDKPYVDNGFGNLWLGCIVNSLGGDWNDISCRGEVTDYHINDEGTELTMHCEIAWAEKPEFRHFLEDKLHVEIYHYSEEPLMALYWTNDKDEEHFKFRYFLDSEIIDPEYFETIEQVADYINDYKIEGLHVEPDFEKISEALDKYSDEHDDDWIALHKIEVDED